MWRPCRMKIKGVHPDIVHKVGPEDRRDAGEGKEARMTRGVDRGGGGGGIRSKGDIHQFLMDRWVDARKTRLPEMEMGDEGVWTSETGGDQSRGPDMGDVR